MSERYCRRVDEYGVGRPGASRQSVGPDGLSFSIGARASSPRGLRDGLSLCFELKLVLSCGGLWCYWHQRRKEEKIGEEKIRSGRTGGA